MSLIKSIVDTFYLIAKEHKLVRSFVYDRVSKVGGLGDENHPQFLLEDPIYIGTSTITGGSIPILVNFDIIMTPQAFENYNVKQLSESECQSVAMDIALNILARLRDMLVNYTNYEDRQYEGLKIVDYSIQTLRYWYDNSSSGVRVSLNMSAENPINFCDIEEHFDKDKEFAINNLLSDIDTDGASACVTFDYKLPNFKL